MLKLYVTVLLTFAILDAVWIGVLMKGFYSSEFGEIARRQDGAMAPRWPAAILVYLLIPLGIVLFVRPRWEITRRYCRPPVGAPPMGSLLTDSTT